MSHISLYGICTVVCRDFENFQRPPVCGDFEKFQKVPVCGPCTVVCGDFENFQRAPVCEDFKKKSLCWGFFPCTGEIVFFYENSLCWGLWFILVSPLCVGTLKNFKKSVCGLCTVVCGDLKNFKELLWCVVCGDFENFHNFPCVWSLWCVGTLKIFKVPLCVSPCWRLWKNSEKSPVLERLFFSG